MIPASRAPRPHCVHISWVPGWVEGVCGVAVEVFAEVAVDVQDGLDTGVARAGGYDGWVVFEFAFASWNRTGMLPCHSKNESNSQTP